MFSRRHPYLYFILVLSVIITAAIIIMSILLAVCFRDSDFAGLTEIAGEKVGIIEVTGVIADSEEAIRALKNFREDDSVKAIVLRINSPGGGVGPSQEIFREVRKTLPSKITPSP